MNRHVTIPVLVVGFLVLAVAERTLERVARAQTKAPSYQVDPLWPKLPKQWILGQVSGLDVDAQDHVWIIQRPWSLNDDEKAKNPEAECCRAAPPVLEFDAAGNYLQGWGGDGAGYEWPKDEHAIHIDYKGNVWLSSAGGPRLRERTENQILKFTKSGKFLLQIGHRGQSKGSLDTNNFNNAADIYVYPKTNEVFVADGYVNRRVIVLDADTGKFKRMWGAFGNKPADSDSCEVLRNTTFEEPGRQQFSIVHAIRVARDGNVYVADRENRRVQKFSADGKFIKQLTKGDTNFALDLAFSPDQKFLYVGYGKGIAIIDPATLTQVGMIQPQGILGAGHHIQTDSKGNIYIAQTTSGMQRLLYKGMK
jgi:hypothetical protein